MSEDTYSQYRRIRFMWPDHLGLARGKYLPSALADKGSAFCVTTFGLTYDRDILPAEGGHLLDGLKDVHGTPVASTLRPSWEDPTIGVAVADLTFDHGPYDVSPRCTLQRAIDDWAELGYEVKLGIELEGYLLEPDGEGGWRKFNNPRSMVYGTGSLGDPSGFVTAVLDAADDCGFNVESANVEFDESQFEFTLRYDDAMTQCDDVFLFRTMVREVALSMGLDFTFLGKPFPTVSGSGLHYNMSLVGKDGELSLVDDSTSHGASELALQCIAGLVEHHNALAAICAPTVNAYRRLQPGTLAGCWANWGVDHRNVACRLPADGGAAMRVEHRLADGAVNVHLGAAALLQAARLGVVNAMTAPDEYTGDGFGDGGEGVGRCADNLSGALDDLEADTALVEAIGPNVVSNYITHKRNEVEAFEASGASIDGDELSDWEVARYLPYH